VAGSGKNSWFSALVGVNFSLSANVKKRTQPLAIGWAEKTNPMAWRDARALRF